MPGIVKCRRQCPSGAVAAATPGLPPSPVEGGNHGAYWNMEGIDANTFNDLTDTDADLTTSAATRVAGKIGHAVHGQCNVSLSGLQTSIGGTPGLTYRGNGISLEFWAKFNNISGGGTSAAIISYKIGSGQTVGLFFSSSTGAAVDFILDARNSTQYAIVVSPDVWYHWAWVWNPNGSYTVYQNGAVIASSVSLYSLANGVGTPAFLIGPGSGGIGRTLEWSVDELGLWCDYVLTAANVAYLYNSGMGRTYPFT